MGFSRNVVRDDSNEDQVVHSLKLTVRPLKQAIWANYYNS